MLSPEWLASRFGPRGNVAAEVVDRFHGALRRAPSRVESIFASWVRIFGAVYGEGRGKVEKETPRLAAIYGKVGGAELRPLLFAVHTYCALLMKLLAAEVASSSDGDSGGPFLRTLRDLSDGDLRDGLGRLEDGSTFASLGVDGFTEGDLFGWYLHAWSPEVASGIRRLARALGGSAAGGVHRGEGGGRDLFKKLYQEMVPRQMRRRLGEYYTPDWLTERLLSCVGYEGEPGLRLLDPACGSGTFLILAMERIRRHLSGRRLAPADILEATLGGIAGIDLNPLGVLASRTNCLVAIRDLIAHRRGPVTLPVRGGDSILAPMRGGRFDFVVGNPPWVNWQDLSPGYREQTKGKWVDYGLFSLGGRAARLGGGKKDLAMLFLYAAADRFLKRGGRLGFVMTQSALKTRGAGDGFRRFRIGKDGDRLAVLHVDDLSRLQPFDGVIHRACILICRRGEPTRYPVPYTLWGRGRGRGRVEADMPLDDVIRETTRVHLGARPVDEERLTSPWITARDGALRAIGKVIGPAPYRARAGCYSGGLNAVFWVRILSARSDGRLVIRNLREAGRREVKAIERPIEPDLVYPLLRGRDLSRWHGEPSAHVVISQDPKTRMAYEERWMKAQVPLTYAYLAEFEEDLARRRSRSVRDLAVRSAFYAMYAVADYTFAPYKVVWKALAREMAVAVVSSVEDRWFRGRRVVVPEHNTIFIPTEDEREAHYLCSILNSGPSGLLIRAHASLFWSAGILQHLAVPRFRPDDAAHDQLAGLSREAHRMAAAGDRAGLARIETEVNEGAAEIWGIPREEMDEIRLSLEDLR